MPLNMKNVSLNKIHNFLLGQFEVFRENLENAAKVRADIGGQKEPRGFFSGVLTKVDYG
jgi:hypothetical protein